MISINLSERSTWRGIVMAITGLFALGFIVPIIFEMLESTTNEHLQFLALKSTIIGSAIGLIGSTLSGLIGILFADKP